MTNITIRKLDGDVEDRLRARAASNGHSVEEEACAILRDAVGEPTGQDTRDVASIFRSFFGPTNGVELDIPPRCTSREPPTFD
ncbi:MAG: plasmid stabilization protein [Gammaproteobacteria bacterium]|nr:plasmid stabilization protein [Gammaproteobacteria bacterium]